MLRRDPGSRASDEARHRHCLPAHRLDVAAHPNSHRDSCFPMMAWPPTLIRWRRVRAVRPVVASLEKWYAAYSARAMRAACVAVRASECRLIGRDLYRRVLQHHFGTDARTASNMLYKAEQSFCVWPVERELLFHHVVAYIVFDSYNQSEEPIYQVQNDIVRIVFRCFQ